jgi:hypothetical protein
LGSAIAIGLVNESTPTFLLVGWGRGSWGYHSDDGSIVNEDDAVGNGRSYGAGSTVGVAYDPAAKKLWFTLGGERVG